jgi:hypothetical protein
VRAFDDACRYYDRRGNPISFEQWADLSQDPHYKHVMSTTLRDGTSVSTIWLGLDHGWGYGDREIFETMVFPASGWGEHLCHRYPTEEMARADHDQVVANINEAYDRLQAALDEIGEHHE